MFSFRITHINSCRVFLNFIFNYVSKLFLLRYESNLLNTIIINYCDVFLRLHAVIIFGASSEFPRKNNLINFFFFSKIRFRKLYSCLVCSHNALYLLCSLLHNTINSAIIQYRLKLLKPIQLFM